MTSASRDGVYVLANDTVLPWLRSFVRSYRSYNPHLSLCLIPFDDQADDAIRLIGDAGGEVLIDHDSFCRLERIGRALELGYSHYGPHWFRRYKAFDGPFDRFLYLDTRIVVLSDLRAILNALTEAEVDLVHFDASLNQVYRQGPLRTDFVRRGGGHGFFSGMWAARRGLFTLQDMEAAGTALSDIRDQMNNRNTDQFFINYLCDTHQKRTVHYADLDEHVVHLCWAGDGHEVYRDSTGVWRKWAFGQRDHRLLVPFVNWAGYRLSPAMPLYNLFDRFQPGHYGMRRRFISRLRELPGRVVHMLRSNRFLNTLYHTMRAGQ